MHTIIMNSSGCLLIGWQRNWVWPTCVLHVTVVQIGTRIVCLMYDVLEAICIVSLYSIVEY